MSLCKILLLGGKTGMLGQALRKEGLSQGYEIFSLGREDALALGKNFVSYDFLAQAIAKINPNVIINAVGYTAVDDAEDDIMESYLINKELPVILAQIIKDCLMHLIHYSTDFVFDGKKTSPYVEEDMTNPLSVYGASKLEGEQALSNLHNVTILRTAWLYGHGRKNFVSTILNFAKEKPLLRVVHDQVGSPTSTKDLAKMTFAVVAKKQCGLFHTVNVGQASWCEFAREAVYYAGLKTEIEAITSDDWPQKAIRPSYSVLSTDKFSHTFSFEPRFWKEALKEYIDEQAKA